MQDKCADIQIVYPNNQIWIIYNNNHTVYYEHYI